MAKISKKNYKKCELFFLYLLKILQLCDIMDKNIFIFYIDTCA